MGRGAQNLKYLGFGTNSQFGGTVMPNGLLAGGIAQRNRKMERQTPISPWSPAILCGVFGALFGI
jgi:hypothetical protein